MGGRWKCIYAQSVVTPTGSLTKPPSTEYWDLTCRILQQVVQRCQSTEPRPTPTFQTSPGLSKPSQMTLQRSGLRINSCATLDVGPTSACCSLERALLLRYASAILRRYRGNGTNAPGHEAYHSTVNVFFMSNVMRRTTWRKK